MAAFKNESEDKIALHWIIVYLHTLYNRLSFRYATSIRNVIVVSIPNNNNKYIWIKKTAVS